MKQTFLTKLRQDGAIEVPLDIKGIYGVARPPVRMTVLGETHRTRIAVYGGKYVLGLWKEMLERHGLHGGESLEVTLEPDTTPRTVTPPKDLAAVLKKNAAARAGWEAMSFTHKREWSQAIRDAKKPETREKRLAQAEAALMKKAHTKKTVRSVRKSGS